MSKFKHSIKRRQLLTCCLAGSYILPLGIHLPAKASELEKKDVHTSDRSTIRPTIINVSEEFYEPVVKISEITTSPTFRGTGYPRLDKSLAIILTEISRKFKVNPAFGFYDDVIQPNAKAFREIIVPGTDGTVRYGRRYFMQNLTNEHTDFLVVAICAHEFGHIARFNSKLGDRFNGAVPNQYQELHADYLAGYYLGSTRINYTKNELYAIGLHHYSIGGGNPSGPSYHGTPLERLHAVENGYHLAKENPQTDIDSAFLSGIKYLNI